MARKVIHLAQRKRRKARKRPPKRRSWSRWSVPLLALVLVGAWYFGQPVIAPKDWVTIDKSFGTCGEPGRPLHCVTDGDTVTIGYSSSARRIRLTGFDAPEINGRCHAERREALRAQYALRAWLNDGAFEWDGGAAPPRDHYSRELREARRVSADGKVERLADHMIKAGLASGDGPFQYREWCD